MIQQLSGHRSFDWLGKQNSEPVFNYSYNPHFPLMSKVIVEDFNQAESRGNLYHYPEVIKTLPEPNCTVPELESSPHLWHFKDTQTDIEFFIVSDCLKDECYKGTSIEVLHSENEHCTDDGKLSSAYARLLDFIVQCYTSTK